jgi:phage shock protein PspC (stress-responsive transcriptional regulator)
MSQQEPKNEEVLSDEQLEGVSGGLTDRFDEARRENLDKGLQAEGELSEDQLKGVAGGLNERFDDARQANLDK